MTANKITALIVALSMMASMAACVSTTPVSESSVPDKPDSSSTSIGEDRSEDIIQQEKTALAGRILSGELDIHDSPDYVWSGHNGSTNLNHVEQLLASIDKGEAYSFMGRIAGYTIPFVYEIENHPDGGVAVTAYSNPSLDEVTAERYTVTDIYITDSFYQFTDNSGLFLSLPRHSLEKEDIEGYVENSDLAGATVTAEQACQTATEAISLLNGAVGHARQTSNANIMNSYGVIIPTDTVFDPTVTEQITPKAGGAVTQGRPVTPTS